MISSLYSLRLPEQSVLGVVKVPMSCSQSDFICGCLQHPHCRIYRLSLLGACRRHQRCWEGNGDLGTSPFLRSACDKHLLVSIYSIGGLWRKAQWGWGNNYSEPVAHKVLLME
jgi:hypothetical protein